MAIHTFDQIQNPISGITASWHRHLRPDIYTTKKFGGLSAAMPLPDGRGPFLVVSYMTALSAISVNPEALPHDATGDAIILIRDAGDKQYIIKPTGVTVHWVVAVDLGPNPSLLSDDARKLPSLGQLDFAWVACEFEARKLLRQYIRVEQQFGPERLYMFSYWKRGLVKGDHKQIKRADAEADA